jgi:HSP20 family protein
MAITPYRASTDLFRPIFDEFLGSGWGGRMAGMGRLGAPRADVVETEDEIRVVVELPGMTAEDIDLDLENNVLTISGEKQEERDEGDENTWHLSERRYGKFSRSFVLPRDVKQDRIEASFENGVLQVTVPKSEKARRRRIEIRAPAAGSGWPGASRSNRAGRGPGGTGRRQGAAGRAPELRRSGSPGRRTRAYS